MEGNKKAEDRMNMVNVITVGVVGVLLVWVSVVALQTYYKSTLDEEEARRMTQGQEGDLVKVQAAQRAQLTGYAMRSSAAASKKVAVIPVERAMDLVVQDLKAKPDGTTVPEVGAQDKATIHPFPRSSRSRPRPRRPRRLRPRRLRLRLRPRRPRPRPRPRRPAFRPRPLHRRLRPRRSPPAIRDMKLARHIPLLALLLATPAAAAEDRYARMPAEMQDVG